jgi:hypothetical protein
MLKQSMAAFVGAAAIGFGFVGNAEAAVFGGATSNWANPDPVGNADLLNVDIFGYNSVTWGTAIPSGLGFKSNNNVSFNLGESFKVGQLGFFNTLDLDTQVLEAVDLELALDFLMPDFDVPVVFNLAINSTSDNLFLCGVFGFRCNPDSVDIAPNPLLGTTVQAANGRKYRVDLQFSKDPLVAQELNLKDFKDFKIDAFQVSHLEATVSKVPEPASVLAVLAFGGVAAGTALKKKQAA